MKKKNEKKSVDAEAVVNSIKKTSRRTQIAVITAVGLFVVTFALNFIIGTIFKAPSEITDWKFVSSSSEKDISGNITSFKQATKENPVSKSLGENYIRLQYTVDASTEDMRLTIKTAYNPIKVMLNDSELYDNGYGTQNFTGNAYHSLKIKGNGNQQTLDIFMYAPLAFNVNATLETENVTGYDLFTQYLGFGISFGITVLGIGMFLLSVMLTSGSKNIKRMLMLSVTVLFGGLTSLLYSVLNSTAILTSPYWMSALLVMQMLLMMLTFATVNSCSNNALKPTLFFIPVVIVCSVIPIFGTSWAIRIAATVFALSECFIGYRSLKALSISTGTDVPHVGLIRGLTLFAGLTGAYNAVCLFFGLNMLSSYLYSYSIVIVCLVTFVVFCHQIVYLDVKKNERIAQIYKDSTWIESITNLISGMFIKKDENQFLIEIAKSLSAIIEKNTESDEDIEVLSCIGVTTDGSFTELYNCGDLTNCRYAEIAEHLKAENPHLLIGNTTVDMLFDCENHSAVIHFENIVCGMYGNIRNVVCAAYGNLYVAYQNLSLKKDMSSLQEELFIHLAQIVEQRSCATNQHQIAVSALTYELCRELGMNEEHANLIATASMAHDIGKIAIPEAILGKKGKLTFEEYEIIKKHTDYGYNILSLQRGEFFKVASAIALEHHENFDGSGYIGKSGREINSAARVVRVIDVFEALLSKRSYKEAWSVDEAVNYISNGKGTLFDPAVVNAFMKCYERLVNLRDTIYSEEQA